MSLSEIIQKEYVNIEKKEDKVQALGNSNIQRLSSNIWRLKISKGKGNEAFSEMGRNLERDGSQ